MTHEELKAKALVNPDVKAEYDALAPEFSLLRLRKPRPVGVEH